MTTYIIRAHDRVYNSTEVAPVYAKDFDHAAHLAWKMFGKSTTKTVVIDGGELGCKRADQLNGWYESIWNLMQK